MLFAAPRKAAIARSKIAPRLDITPSRVMHGVSTVITYQPLQGLVRTWPQLYRIIKGSYRVWASHLPTVRESDCLQQASLRGPGATGRFRNLPPATGSEGAYLQMQGAGLMGAWHGMTLAVGQFANGGPSRLKLNRLAPYPPAARLEDPVSYADWTFLYLMGVCFFTF